MQDEWHSAVFSFCALFSFYFSLAHKTARVYGDWIAMCTNSIINNRDSVFTAETESKHCFESQIVIQLRVKMCMNEGVYVGAAAWCQYWCAIFSLVAVQYFVCRHCGLHPAVIVLQRSGAGQTAQRALCSLWQTGCSKFHSVSQQQQSHDIYLFQLDTRMYYHDEVEQH